MNNQMNNKTSEFKCEKTRWKTVRLGEVADICTGKRNNQDKVSNGKYPFFVRSSSVERINSYAYDGEAILMPGEGNIGDIVHYVNGRFDYHQRVYKISSFSEGVLGKYIYHVLRATFKNWALGQTVKATVDSLRLPTFQNFVLQLPPTKQQKEIAEALDTIDSQVSSTQRLLAKYESIKKATVKKLMTPGDGWVTVPLCELCDISSSKRVFESDWTDSGVPFYRAREIVALNDGRKIEPLHISEELYQENIKMTGEIKSGDLLVTGVGSIGVPYLVKPHDRFYFKDGNIIWFKNKGRIHPEFFLYSFRDRYIQTQIRDMACIGTVGSYTISNAKRTLINLPNFSQQTVIASQISKIEQTISQLNSIMHKMRALKQSMLQYFFGD